MDSKWNLLKMLQNHIRQTGNQSCRPNGNLPWRNMKIGYGRGRQDMKEEARMEE